MNIIFIDEFIKNEKITLKKKDKITFNLFGFYIEKYKINKKIYIFKVIVNKDKSKINLKLYKKIIDKICNKSIKNYFVFSKKCNNDKFLFTKNSHNMVVTEQNNLATNDTKYIKKYLDKNDIPRENVKVLMIIDNINNFELDKIKYYISIYKILNIYLTNNKIKEKVENIICNINNELGTTIDLVSKINLENYNVILIFSKNYPYDNNLAFSNLFFLDYNNSDLDICSSTYKAYYKNKNEIIKLFNRLNLDISRFEKTKLGKLYIHVGRLSLDK